MTTYASPFISDGALPKRGATAALKNRIQDYLLRTRPDVGEALMTDAQLCEQLNISRSSVRRAMAQLQAEGWIERYAGRGTFVGPRVAIESAKASGAAGASDRVPKAAKNTDVVRLAAVVFWDANLIANWYTPEVLRGIGDVADRCNVSVELISHSRPNPDAVLARFQQNPPDAVVFPTGDMQEMLVIRDAQRLGIPVIVIGTKFAELGVPTIVEDNFHAIDLAVDHLVDQGHRDIALSVPTAAVKFPFDRQRAFLDAMKRHRIDASGGEVHWLEHHVESDLFEVEIERLKEFLASRRPGALIAGNSTVLKAAGEAVRRLGWSVPDDLSIVAIDQSPEATGWLHGLKPVTVEIPLQAMGRKVAEYAPALARGEEIPVATCLPCRLVDGTSVGPPPRKP
ncbi:MAG: GntR family transcriptional regulator [Planctomycetota bacterium]